MSSQEKNYVRRHITQALLQLLEKQTLEELIIKQVCTEAQVGRASFYRHFRSLEDVLSQHARQLMTQWSKEVETSPQANPDRVFESFFQHVLDNRTFYLLLYRYQLTETILETLKDKFELNDTLPNPVAYGKSLFAHAVFGWITEWLLRGTQESPQELNQLFKEQTLMIFGSLNLLFDNKNQSDKTSL